MTPKEIAEKYVHGLHDNLTDTDEKREMVSDIEDITNQAYKNMTVIAIVFSVAAFLLGYWMALQDCGCSF